MSLAVSRGKSRQLQISGILPCMRNGMCRWLRAELTLGLHSRSQRGLLNPTIRFSLRTFLEDDPSSPPVASPPILARQYRESHLPLRNPLS